jgi:membrane protein
MAAAGSGSGRALDGPFRLLRKAGGTLWRLLSQTVGTCLRYRVTGLAAEGAFFAILSLPPLIFGLAGSIGFLANRFDVETINDIRNGIIDLASEALTDRSVQEVIVPTLNDVLGTPDGRSGGRFDVISIGFLLALWSGSRALNVFVDTITIMYGMGGKRGIVKTRALSFTLYCVALVIGVVVLPLVLAGPSAVDALLPSRLDFLNQLYWPVVIVLSVGFLNTLYHLSVPVRTPWVSDLPGSALALSLWILGSFLLRWTLQTTVGDTSIYGPLAAPIAVLLWLYLTAIAVLIGAALNAVIDRTWPHRTRPELREKTPRDRRRSKILARSNAASEHRPRREKTSGQPVRKVRRRPRITTPVPGAPDDRLENPVEDTPPDEQPAGAGKSGARRSKGDVA